MDTKAQAQTIAQRLEAAFRQGTHVEVPAMLPRFAPKPAPKPTDVPQPVVAQKPRTGFFATVTIASEGKPRNNSTFFTAFVKVCEAHPELVGQLIDVVAPPNTLVLKGSLDRIGIDPMTVNGEPKADKWGNYVFFGFWMEPRALKGQKAAGIGSIVPRDEAGKRTGFNNVVGHWAPKKAPKA